jgi:predicted nuclease of predicted toxin-antitoxin system
VNIVIDMNLSPTWVKFLEARGWTVRHWSTVGDPQASDRTIMKWAVDNDHMVLTHDLDFGALLALTHAAGPSVVLVRDRDILPDAIGVSVVAALKQYREHLARGAIVVVDGTNSRVRILPL